MLGYWKWLYKLSKMLAKFYYKWLLSQRKTKLSRQIHWVILDFAIILTILTIFVTYWRPIIGFGVFMIGVILFVGHMIYIDLEV